MMRYCKHASKKERDKVHKKETKSHKKTTKNPRKNSSLRYQTNQSTKSIIVKVPTPVYIFAHKNRLLKKTFFRIWIVQKMHKETTFHIFLHFLPMKEPCHHNRVSLTKANKIQGTTAKEPLPRDSEGECSLSTPLSLYINRIY